MPSLTQAQAESFRNGSDAFDVIVSFDVGGQERHMASQPFAVECADDTHILVNGGLLNMPQLPEMSASIRNASAAVGGAASVTMDAAEAGWMRAVSARVPLQQIRVAISILPTGGMWEDRITLYSGLVRSPSWSVRDGEVSFNVVNMSPDAEPLIPRSLVSENKYASGTLPERNVGEVAPILYGTRVYGVHGIVIQESVDDNRILIAQHHISSGVNEVALYRGKSDGYSITLFTAVNGYDLRGNLISYVSLTDAQYWEDFAANTKPFTFVFDAPGKLGRNENGATVELRFLGEMLLDLIMTYSGLGGDRVNHASFRELDATIPIEVSMQLTQQKTATGWINEIVSSLPLTVAWIGGKLMAIASSYTTPPPVAAVLRFGHELTNMVRRFEQEAVEQVTNALSVHYAYRNRQERFMGLLEYGPDYSMAANLSAQRYGVRARNGFVDLWQVEDAASANRIGDELIARQSPLPVHVSYLAEARHVTHLRPMDVVQVIDEDEGVDALFDVERIQPGVDGSYVVGLVSRGELEFTE